MALVIRTPKALKSCKKEQHVSQTTRIAQGDSKGLGLLQIGQDTLKVPRWRERRAQGEPEVDGLLAHIVCLWQMGEGAERLLKIPRGLTVSRPRHGFLPRLPEIR
jgi:hypothetical protein